MYSELVSVSQAPWTSIFKDNLRWMAPELLGEREDGSPVQPSKQSDVFSCGDIMLQLSSDAYTPWKHLPDLDTLRALAVYGTVLALGRPIFEMPFIPTYEYQFSPAHATPRSSNLQYLQQKVSTHVQADGYKSTADR
ncbi:hypothetical protein K503DRAFT_780585 [Rhizopogon vinicolor AM-OR11-026]|uniref:Protein kinase domain-containing protein n=1 Tax=Rhizopogon vinicolor AM-OR11-026 TaxID=1314800 RepID=A0A1B7N9H4_9AGAM|nr:hypothetical protein K503DRAFT_780585 [Rhizopogon vinicolor AM-OR11-026]